MTGGIYSLRCVTSRVPSDVGSIALIGSEALPLSLCVETDTGNPPCSVLVIAV